MGKQPSDDSGANESDRDDRETRASRLSVSPAARRLMGAGMELAGYALILGGAGYLLDGQVGWQRPYLGVIGVVGGFALGFYRLILIVNRLGSHETGKDNAERALSDRHSRS